MSIHGSMFNVNDVENAADDPFSLGQGRKRIVVSESGPDSITVSGEDLSVWKVVLRDPEDDPESFRRQDVLFFLDGDELAHQGPTPNCTGVKCSAVWRS